MMTLADWLQRIEQLHPQEIDLGTERVAQVWQALSMPLNGYVVTVAGTNGKGSTVAALETAGLISGYSVGAFTSPHILRYNERIRLNGNEVSDAMICDAFERIDKARGEISLTYFEFNTLAALVIFSLQNVDLVLLEVGLGGRMDAVNIIDANMAIVTSIALDHEDWLGSDLEFIAAEKSAVSRPGNPLIIGDVPELEYWHTLQHRDGDTYFYGRDFSLHNHIWHSGVDQIALGRVFIPENSIAVVLQAVKICPLFNDLAACSKAIVNTRVAGRMQKVHWHGREMLLDVAHNPASVELLCQRLEDSGHKYVMVFAAMADKELTAMVPQLARFASEMLIPQLQIPRADKPHNIAKLVPNNVPVKCFESMATLFESLKVSESNQPVLVAGSFYTVAEAMSEMHIDTRLPGASYEANA